MPAAFHFVEVDLFGVYVAPLAPMMVIAYAILFALRWCGLETGLLQRVWHPALFQVALYLAILSAIVLLAYGVGMAQPPTSR